MEEWDLLNENRELTGKTHIRGEKLAPGELHLVVHVCIFNEKGQLLIQKRQKDKEGWPNYWDLSTAGSALKGETSLQAAEREVQEELGITIDLSNTRAKFSYHFEAGFDDYWFITKDVELSDLTLQKEEVADARFVTKEALEVLRSSGEFIPYFFLNQLFDLKNATSIHF
ncbi:NUDIX domain-containing protein [Listeria monocytogenes]|uniref:NUDIX hydrolase n=1 Tax=Listeria monocytogenes TaxID=1639 RepID=UPI0011EAD6A2|nr:NUDIX domain-containing protein [Listeria monocytogenes]EIM5650287.1 NUDIX domain-containing protein [Listeria monocytogenes]EJH4943048.1 NUDIX domain-containing protein [Listeria monocytogenes]EJH4972001.1 NUDIX domain-containing protein [Listeria monocytogenes]EJH5059556.1 NUDIX domain-containing protein [Listeria monocytogenes]TYU59249.1 NUDIX domain-containing protein [Listeria monocytogenes]